MNKLYKYLAVALCALVGAGSAAAQNPDKLYLYSSHCITSGDWTPYYITFADNESGVYRFKGVPLVANEYFVLASGTMNGWTVNDGGKRYEPVRDDTHQTVTFGINDASSFDEGSNHCWQVQTTGIYNIEINFQTKNLAFNRSEDNNNSYRIHGTIYDSTNWQDLMMTHNVAEGVWEYKGPIKSGYFGIKICVNGEQTGWNAGSADITVADQEYNFDGQDNSHTSLSGNYIVKYDPTNKKMTFVSFPLTDKPYLGYDNFDETGWHWGETITETSTPYVYEVTKEFNEGAYFKVSTYSGGFDGKWDDYNAASYGVNANDGDNVETSTVNGQRKEVNKGYKGAWRVSEAGKYKITVDFRSETKQYITVTKLASPLTDKPYLGYDNFDETGWHWGETITETSTPYVYEVTKIFNEGAFFKVSTYSGEYDGKWDDYNAAAYGINASDENNVETSTVDGQRKEVNKGYKGAWRVSEAGKYKITVDFSSDDGKQYVTVTKLTGATFTINGTTAPKICGVYVGIDTHWTETATFTKVSDTEYTYTFTATQENAYFGLYDSAGIKFVPGGLTLTDGLASTTSFTETDKEFVGNDTSNECKISGLTTDTEYVLTLKNEDGTVTLTIEAGDDPTPGPETTVVTSEMIAGMIPTLPGAMYQVFEFEKTNNSDGKEKVLNAKGYNGVDAVTPANYYWVKYEDESVYYNDGVLNTNIYAASDNPRRDDITEDDDSDWKLEDSTDKNYHDCRNFSDAYYRVYMQNTEVPAGYQVWEGRPSAPTPTVLTGGFEMAAAERTSIVNPHYGKDKLNVAQRVARTIFVESNTTGIEDVISPETSDDADAPVVFYNLQGMRVENPSNGIYIRVQGKTTTKVYIK